METLDEKLLYLKINKDKCYHTISYDCPECGLEQITLMQDINIVGWTMIERAYTEEYLALVYECPQCFHYISSHFPDALEKIKKVLL